MVNSKLFSKPKSVKKYTVPVHVIEVDEDGFGKIPYGRSFMVIRVKNWRKK